MGDPGDLLASLYRAVLDGDHEGAGALTRRALAEGLEPLEVIDGATVPAIRRAGELWEDGEYFLPELVTAAQAMKAAMAELLPSLGAQEAGQRSEGTVVIGTVAGDIHDIGKTLVSTMLTAHGFTVADEGANVPVARLVARAAELDADLVCASALLTTTMTAQRDLVLAVREAGIRARVMVGGAPCDGRWAAEIGADGYADSAISAVAEARRLITDG